MISEDKSMLLWEKEGSSVFYRLCHLLLENKAGVITPPTYYVMFLSKTECDGGETTDDSHFTVKDCKGNIHSHALKNTM